MARGLNFRGVGIGLIQLAAGFAGGTRESNESGRDMFFSARNNTVLPGCQSIHLVRVFFESRRDGERMGLACEEKKPRQGRGCGSGRHLFGGGRPGVEAVRVGVALLRGVTNGLVTPAMVKARKVAALASCRGGRSRVVLASVPGERSAKASAARGKWRGAGGVQSGRDRGQTDLGGQRMTRLRRRPASLRAFPELGLVMRWPGSPPGSPVCTK